MKNISLGSSKGISENNEGKSRDDSDQNAFISWNVEKSEDINQ